ncbi:MAG: DNA polymerase/3'-5' exonuclease PolX [Candidatus Methanospirareceae archaeon]
MKNRVVADILYEIADLLEMQEVEFKPRAFRRAAQNIESQGEDIEELYQEDRLGDIPGVGESIANIIAEYLETGAVERLEKLRKQRPMDIKSLSAVEGLGPKRITKLYQELGITNLDELETAAKKGHIREIKGFGEKTEQNILENIAFARKSQQRFLLGYVLPEAEEILALLEDHTDRVDVAGSLRRKKETIGDIDILAVAAQPAAVMDFFTELDRVEKVLAKGDTKSSVRLYGGVQVDIRLIAEESFGSALQYFTGSKSHNIALRKLAQKRDLKLNEYGLFRGEEQQAGRTEEEVYQALGLAWIPPELREDRGEIPAAQQDQLPRLVDYEEVKGDLQMHTTWSDGVNSIEEMVDVARRMGHAYIAITDHVGSLKIAGGMDAAELAKQGKQLAKIRENYDDIHVFHGIEANIQKDGELDVGHDVLDQVDVVLASVHSAFRMDEKEMTSRVITALEHPAVNILAHPTCRIIQKRESIKLDFDRVLEAASENQVALEINAFPERLDLNDVNARRAVETGVKLSLGTDAHRKDHLRYLPLGTAVARRGWAERDAIINTYTVQQLQRFFSK